jgi:hypothetical protein
MARLLACLWRLHDACGGCFSPARAAKYWHGICPSVRGEVIVRIRFKTTIEDIVAFNRFHCENSPMWRQQCFMASILLPIIIAVLSLLTFVATFKWFAGDPLVLAIYGAGMLVLLVVFSVAWYFCIRRQMLANVVSAVRKLLAEGTNRGLLGWRNLELVNNRLIVKMELIDTSYDLRAIEKIVSNEEYTFVYTSSIQALVIPMRLYPEDEYREFVAELREAWENRETPRPAEEAAADERIVEGPV